MMNDRKRHEYAELVAALVDNEITDNRLKSELLDATSTDAALKAEHHVQLTVKKTVKSKCRFAECPSSLRNRILLDIRTGNPVEKRETKQVFTLRPYAYAAAVAVIFITLFVFKYTDSQSNGDLQVVEAGFNLDKMALENYKAILAAKLAPQITSDDSSKIQSFFAAKGLQYKMRMVCPKGWRYVGAVVSQDNGEKFGHVVLSDAKGNLLYIFEVDKKYLTSEKKLSLSSKIMSTVMSGSCYTQGEGSMGILINRCGDNVRAVVAKDNPENLKTLFCGLD